MRNLQENYPLKGLNTWRIGGNARFYANAEIGDIPDLLDFAGQRALQTSVLGRGSNVLISDSGVDGLVINLRDSPAHPAVNNNLCEVEAGFFMPKLARRLARDGYGGFEFMVGIPGTVGGGIAMNAGTHAYRMREIRDVLEWVEIITHRGESLRLSADQLDFGFRTSAVLHNPWIITRACFRLGSREDPSIVQRRTIEHLAERKQKQPLTVPTAGSTFKNPPGEHSAGWYVEQARLKGMVLGGAQISTKHANWIVNTGNATSADIIRLILHMQSEVEARFSVKLEPEVRMLGIVPEF